MRWRSPFQKTSSSLSGLSFDVLRQRCAEGDEPACQEFVRRFEGLVWRAVRSRIPSAPAEDQEEVVANTFAALLANRAALLFRYQAALGLSPEGYIHRQAVLQGVNRYRVLNSAKRRRELLLEPGDNETSPTELHPELGPDAEAMLADRESYQRIVADFEQALSPALKLTFQLMFLQELEAADIARILGCSLEVVYTRKKRILDALESVLKAHRQRA